MRLKLASYNIRKAVGLDRRRDPARILTVLNRIGADVVALQEADMRLGDRPAALPRGLIAQETDYVVAGLARNSVSLGWHGNAVLVRRGLEIEAAGHIELPGLEPRGAVTVQVAGVTLVATHLGLMRRWRLKQMAVIRDHLEGREKRALIAGDFNEWSDVRGCEPWEAFHMVWPGRSFHSARPVARLDGIAHGPGLAIREAGVWREGAARVASDHLPIWAEVEGR